MSMTRITVALAAALSLAFTPLAAQETDCDGWVTSDASVAMQFWETATAETVSDCLNAGADANAGNESGDTPLLLAAAYNSNPDVLTMLLDAGADATAVDAGGQTPFEIVMRAGDQMGSDIFWRLFNAGMGRDYSYFDLERRSFDAYDPLQSKFPALYDVTNVASNDVLYVRNAPRADSDIRSALLPTQTNIEILYVTPDEVWGFATMLPDMDAGWVSMRYMARQSEQDEVWYPLLTQCMGQGPSWSVYFDGASWRLSRSGLLYEAEEVSFLIPPNYSYVDRYAVSSNSISAIITKGGTSWGETDLSVGYSIDLVIHDDPIPIDGFLGDARAPSYLMGGCTITPNP